MYARRRENFRTISSETFAGKGCQGQAVSRIEVVAQGEEVLLAHFTAKAQSLGTEASQSPVDLA